MADFKTSKTYENLKTAFAGESQARVKYQFYASRAKKDGYEQIAEIFTETSDNEKEHAKIWYKLLNDGVGDTKENLKLAIEGEDYEYTEMYKEFAKIAREEGFEEIATKFEQVGQSKKNTRIAIKLFLRTSTTMSYLKAILLRFGNAATVGT